MGTDQRCAGLPLLWGIPVRPSYYIYDGAGDFGDRCVDVCEASGLARVTAPEDATFAVAPKLTKFLPRHRWSAPLFGTLIFHPSILPYHRGPDAIRWTVLKGERVSGVTWFWCDDGVDAGPICEQEPVLLCPSESPGRAYHTRFVPAGVRALERAVEGVLMGHPRRVNQDLALGTYESFHYSNQHEKGCLRQKVLKPPPMPPTPSKPAPVRKITAIHGYSRLLTPDCVAQT